MEEIASKARELIRRFKGDSYAFGLGAIARSGRMAGRLGRRLLLVRGRSSEENGRLEGLADAFEAEGLEVAAECLGAAPNSPVGDVERVRDEILSVQPEAVVGLGGGSLLDALKGSITLASLGGACEDYFGVGKVSEEMERTGKALLPLLAVQTASGSAAHLTKYANITDMQTMQKKLFIDMAVVPPAAVFDYRATATMSGHFTAVGAFDGVCHLLEVYFGTAEDHDQFETVAEAAATGLELIVSALPGAIKQPGCEKCREALGLGTDLGGYAIMIGSTNGPHLNSFSLVDLMDHGQATAMLVPYYTCFFAPAIRGKLTRVGEIYRRHGYIDASADLEAIPDGELGRTVAAGMIALADGVGFPTRLDQVDGFSDEHMDRMLAAAKDPALASKLQGMPIPMTAADVDACMRPVLEAARGGDLSLIVPPEG